MQKHVSQFFGWFYGWLDDSLDILWTILYTWGFICTFPFLISLSNTLRTSKLRNQFTISSKYFDMAFYLKLKPIFLKKPRFLFFVIFFSYIAHCCHTTFEYLSHCWGWASLLERAATDAASQQLTEHKFKLGREALSTQLSGNWWQTNFEHLF